MDSYETLNETLVNLFLDVLEIEQKALATSEFQDLTNNDLHVIEAIGMDQPKNMSSIAKVLSVTVGTLTIAMNSLVKKGYVIRQRGRRIVGWFIFSFRRRERRLTAITPGSTRR